MIKLEGHTFGGSPAAVKLSEILSDMNDTNLLAKISKKLSSFSRILKELKKLNTSVSVGLVHLVYKAYLEPTNVSGNIPIPEKVVTFVNNLISTKYKAWMIENKGHIPLKNRIRLNDKETFLP